MTVNQFESKRAEIESIIKNKKIIGIILITVSVIFSLAIFLYNSYFINFISINFNIRMIGLILCLISFSKGYDFIKIPVNPYDHAFFEIFQALRMLDRPGKSELLNKQARRKVLKAHEILYSQQVKRSNAPWHSINNEVEKTFKKNLKTRIAPAIINNTIEIAHLNDIAIAIIGKNISLLAAVNNRLINDLDEIREEKSTITSRMIAITSNNKSLSYIQENKLFRPIIILMVGFVGITLLCFLYSMTFEAINFIDLVSDPAIFILGGLAVSTLIQPLLSARARAADIVAEHPADIVAEHPVEVDEIDLILPSYPRDRWEFLWFKYTGDKADPWGKFIKQTFMENIKFDEDWKEGEVDNTGEWDYVGFRASRIIKSANEAKYLFKIGGDDGIRLSVSNMDSAEVFKISEGWIDQGYTIHPDEITLPKGDFKILLEWYECTGAARASFEIIKRDT